MTLLLYSLWKAPFIEEVEVQDSRYRCRTCGFGRATIKVRLPHVKDGRIYQYKWYCKTCYDKYYAESKGKFPDAIEIPDSHTAWNSRRTEVVAKLFPKREKTKKEKTPDETIQEILDSQQSLDRLHQAEYECHMMNIIKILKKYGEPDLAELVRDRLDSQVQTLGEES